MKSMPRKKFRHPLQNKKTEAILTRNLKKVLPCPFCLEKQDSVDERTLYVKCNTCSASASIVDWNKVQ